jgi:hypothetical protein
MDKVEARNLLAQQLASYRVLPYRDLVKLVGANATVEVRGPSGVEYQIEIEVMWDSPREKVNIRVMGTIDDGRLPGALLPLCGSFVLSPDGRFVEE